MTETLSQPSAAPPAAPRRRHRLLALGVAAVAVAGIGVGIALASPNNTPDQAATPVSQAATTGRQVAMLNQACTNWLDENPTANTPRAWCDNMTGWMNQQIANGSMNHQMMWNNPDQMRSTCRAWMNDNPSAEMPNSWCDSAVSGMWQHMNENWDHRGDWDSWMTDHSMMDN
jgi:hypothetical protein